MKKLLVIICFSLFITACERENAGRDAAEDALKEQLNEIKDFIATTSCTENAGCDIMPIGKNSCGGPRAFIAYATNIDIVVLEKMVQDYNDAELRYNETYGNPSDCSVISAPLYIDCINGQCVATD